MVVSSHRFIGITASAPVVPAWISGAFLADRQLDRAARLEPPWLVVRVENAMAGAIDILAVTVSDAIVPKPEPTRPVVLAPAETEGQRWVSGRYRLASAHQAIGLALRRSGEASAERHDIRVRVREGGLCSLVVAVIDDGIRSDPCSDWTPTCGGWPH